MNDELSLDDQTLILLTQRLEPDREEPEPLTMERLGQIEKDLSAEGYSIGHLQSVAGRGTVGQMHDGEHIQALLDRSFRLGVKAEQWTQQNIEVVCRTGVQYPVRLRERMGIHAPAVLYCMGDPGLLGAIQTTILLPANSSNDLSKYAERLGQAAQKLGSTAAAAADTKADHALISAATSADSSVVGIVTCGLVKASSDKKYVQEIAGNRLLLVSVKAPEEESPHREHDTIARSMIHSLAGRTILVRPGPPLSWQWADLIIPSTGPAQQQNEPDGKAADTLAVENEGEPEDDS